MSISQFNCVTSIDGKSVLGYDSAWNISNLESGEVITSNKTIGFDHKCGYSTLGQFIGVLHRTAPINVGERVTLVLNLRSQEKSFIDDNRMFYLAADNDLNSDWVHELKQDVWKNQLPAYRKYMHKLDAIGKADLI